jgi:FkbM family methyltransferase
MGSASPRISLVVVVDGPWVESKRWLASLAAETAGLSCEVVAVDDATVDDTAKALPAFPGLTATLRADDPKGFAQAATAGATMARGAHLVLVRAGAPLPPGWLKALAGAAEGKPLGEIQGEGVALAALVGREAFLGAGGLDPRLDWPAAGEALATRLQPAGLPVTLLRALRQSGASRARPLPGRPDPGLIFDFGMHHAQDTAFYLAKGFRVVAVEANPLLVEAARRRFAAELASGQLVIEALGVGEREGRFPFYRNLDKDDWSSFDAVWGTRQGTRYEVVEIPCVNPRVLFERHGVPHYAKIDIEGADLWVVRSLQELPARPSYVSVEENRPWYFAELWAAGYRRFKLVNQRQVPMLRCPVPAREGREVDARFEGGATGPFGEETPGAWRSFDEIIHLYETTVRTPTSYLAGDDWFDIHAAVEPD